MYKGIAIGFVFGFTFALSIWAASEPPVNQDCTAQNNAIISCDKHLTTCLSWQARVLMELERLEGVQSGE